MADPTTYRTCWTLEAWAKALCRGSAELRNGLDFETAPHPARHMTTSPLRVEEHSVIAGIGLSWKSPDNITISAYCPIGHWRESAGGVQPHARTAIEMLSEYIKNRPVERVVVVANLAMELSFCLGAKIVWPLPGQLQDVQVAARVLNKGVGIEELIGLKALAVEYLGRQLDTKSELDAWLVAHRFKKGVDIWRAPVALASPYCQDDARDCVELWDLWKEHLHQPVTEWWWHREPDRMLRKDLYELEMDAAVKAIMIGLRGNRVDIAMCKKRAEAAEVLQSVVRRWVQSKLDMPNLNPGSQTQLRGVLFTEAFGLEVSTEHTTDSFKKLPDREQARVIAGTGDKGLKDYASLDIDALKHYEASLPAHKDVFFMLAVYRKCQTALMWFKDNVDEYAHLTPDPWWPDADHQEFLWIIYHRLRTVGTVSGRMASSDFNAQQVPKRLKMLIAADRLIAILLEFLPLQQLNELLNMLDFALAKKGDEAKFVGIEPGEKIIDFSARAMFIPRPGCNWRTHDLSQVEMKGFAHFSGNSMLCGGYGKATSPLVIEQELRALRNVRDGMDPRIAFVGLDIRRHEVEERTNKFDIHQFVADELEIGRKPAKGINFGIVYGMGQRKLCRNLGWDADKGKFYLGQYHGKFPEINVVQAMIKQKLRERGYIFDPFGRRYYLGMDRAYVGLNRLIQGWAASMFKVGFVRTCDLFASPFYGGKIHPIMRRPIMVGPKVLACIHDELDEEIPVEYDDGLLDFAVRSCMTLMGGLRIPLSTSSERSAKSWDSADSTEFDYRGL